jgi:hypothetical protein
MQGLAHRLVTLPIVAALTFIACQPTTPTPTVSPSVAATVSPTAQPIETAVPSPSVGPVLPPDSTVTGRVHLDVRLIGGPLNARMGPSGVWTGSEVIIWGGLHIAGSLGFGDIAWPRSGAAYDPLSDQWRRIAWAPIAGRYGHLAGWTGREMLVWGGYTEAWSQGSDVDTAAYNPRTNRWRVLAQSPLRLRHARTSVMAEGEWVIAVTTKREIQVAAYDPEGDSWRLLPSIPGPPGENNRLIWSGEDLLLVNSTNGLYRLESGADRWVRSGARPIGGNVAWTGSELLGVEGDALVRYDDVVDSWQDIPGPGVEDGRLVWTGTHLLVVADQGRPSYLYDPRTEIWLEVSWPRRDQDLDQVSVWAADRLVEWGGWQGAHGGPPSDAGWAIRPDLRHVDLFAPRALSPS